MKRPAFHVLASREKLHDRRQEVVALRIRFSFLARSTKNFIIGLLIVLLVC